MTAPAERDEVSELAADSGWQYRQSDRMDYYTRQPERVRVIWQGHNVISGGVLYRDGVLMSLTRDLKTVKAWLKG